MYYLITFSALATLFQEQSLYEERTRKLSMLNYQYTYFLEYKILQLIQNNCGNGWQIKDGCYRFQKYFCFQQNTFLITFLLAVIFHKPV